MVNSKLTVGIHVLALLALAGATPLTSETIAESVNTNSAVIRRLLGVLRASGYVESSSGPGGGWQLTRAPDDITLLDLRRALEPDHEVFPLHNNLPSPACPVGGNIQGILRNIYGEVMDAVDRRLSITTIGAVLRSVTERI